MRTLVPAVAVLAACCVGWSCGQREEAEPRAKKSEKAGEPAVGDAGEVKRATDERAGEMDGEFVATMKSLSVYDPALEGAARRILDAFDERYTSRDAKRVLKAARRIWFPDTKGGVVVRSGGFVRAGGHKFTWRRGEVSEADREFLDAYAQCLAGPLSEQRRLRQSLPTEGVSEHLRALARDQGHGKD